MKGIRTLGDLKPFTMYFFFSSDAFDLYKRDIISALALPEGYCVHFRYPKDLLPKTEGFIKSLTSKDGIIVYVKGNDLTKPANERELNFLPIRNVLVKHVDDNSTTGLIHVFLELGKFITTAPLRTILTSDLEIPPNKFVHINDSQFGTVVCEWHEKVQELIAFDNSFQNKLFYNLNIRNQGKSDKSQGVIYFDEAEKASFFQLFEEKNYTLDLATYNSSVSHTDYEKHSIKLDYNAENFFITNPESIVIGADKDNRSFKIVTKDIKSSKSSSYIKIQSLLKDLDANNKEIEIIACEEVIKLNIAREKYKSMAQVFLNLLTFIGPILGAYGLSQVKTGVPVINTYTILAAICLAVTSIGQLKFKKN